MHHGWFQVTDVRSLDAKLGRGVQNQPPQADSSPLLDYEQDHKNEHTDTMKSPRKSDNNG